MRQCSETQKTPTFNVLELSVSHSMYYLVKLLESLTITTLIYGAYKDAHVI